MRVAASILAMSTMVCGTRTGTTMKRWQVLAVCGALGCAAGCKKTDTTTLNYANAINSYYTAHPECVWDEPVKFPVQVDTKDASKTTGFDALVDQGLLLRTTAEKQVFIIASKQVTNYDLNDRGHSAWTPDPAQPGYGNFCFGHRNVQSIDASTPAEAQPGATTQVSYRYTLIGMPSWAIAAETQTAFPVIHASLAGPATDTATLVDTTAGWQMKAVAAKKPIGAADGKIVE